MTNKISQPRVNRRTFLAAVPAIASSAAVAAGTDARLAVSGGTPVRTSRLATEYPGAQFYDEQERTELTQAYDSHSLFRFYGPGNPQKAADFERELKTYIGTRYALGVTSGTAALHCALTALGVGPGDEVILPAWTWHSGYTAILMTGALPVFAEVDDSFGIDAADIEAKITPNTKAIMVVHLFGGPADMDRIMPMAHRHGIKVLEDVAQSAGGKHRGRRLGSIGDIGIYSFQLHKVITAGEGGAVVTNDPVLYERAIRFHDLGLLRPVHKEALGGAASMPYFLGLNYRMNEMTGAVMRAQLRKLDTIVAQQRRSWLFVKERVQELPGWKLRQSHDPEGDIGWTLNLIFGDKGIRNRFVSAMIAENVPMSAPSSATPLPPFPYIENKIVPHPAWPTFNTPRGREIRYGAQCCPRTLDIFNRAATLTIGPKFAQSDLKDIVAAIQKVHGALLA
jgi:8-amino-3,8-dideoxy-alpha-D-manno-octulosonate transaminase